jgi:ubiquinone/menaquinone biosynthesis C-methylase UbiE
LFGEHNGYYIHGTLCKSTYNNERIAYKVSYDPLRREPGSVRLGEVLMHTTKKTYLSAAGKDWLLPFYDLFTWLLGVRTVHNKLIRQSAIEAGHQLLEIGCGPGNLAILAKRLNPKAQVVGIDPDPKALVRARRKAQRSGFVLQFDPGFSEELPYPDASFDRVLSAFMLHHVEPDAKLLAIQEACRVLKSGGSLHLVDFEQVPHHGGGLHGFLASIIHAQHRSSPQQAVLGLMRDAGFEESHEVARQTTILGRVVFYKAVRPHSPASIAA